MKLPFSHKTPMSVKQSTCQNCNTEHTSVAILTKTPIFVCESCFKSHEYGFKKETLPLLKDSIVIFFKKENYTHLFFTLWMNMKFYANVYDDLKKEEFTYPKRIYFNGLLPCIYNVPEIVKMNYSDVKDIRTEYDFENTLIEKILFLQCYPDDVKVIDIEEDTKRKEKRRIEMIEEEKKRKEEVNRRKEEKNTKEDFKTKKKPKMEEVIEISDDEDNDDTQENNNNNSSPSSNDDKKEKETVKETKMKKFTRKGRRRGPELDKKTKNTYFDPRDCKELESIENFEKYKKSEQNKRDKKNRDWTYYEPVGCDKDGCMLTPQIVYLNEKCFDTLQNFCEVHAVDESCYGGSDEDAFHIKGGYLFMNDIWADVNQGVHSDESEEDRYYTPYTSDYEEYHKGTSKVETLSNNNDNNESDNDDDIEVGKGDPVIDLQRDFPFTRRPTKEDSEDESSSEDESETEKEKKPRRPITRSEHVFRRLVSILRRTMREENLPAGIFFFNYKYLLTDVKSLVKLPKSAFNVFNEDPEEEKDQFEKFVNAHPDLFVITPFTFDNFYYLF